MAATLDAFPPGWEINPSARGQRAIIVIVALIGLVASIAAALHVSWEPFPVVTRGGWVLAAPRVIAPEVDVIAFSFVVMAALLGHEDRWRSRPLFVIALGAAVVSCALSLLVRWSWQYFTLDTTSTLFSVALGMGIVLLPLAADEVYAATLALRPRREPVTAEENGEPHVSEWPSYVAGVGGILVGLMLLVAPASRYSQLIGAFIAAIGALALAQTARPVRWLNAVLGGWLVVAPLFLGHTLRGMIYSMISGMFLLVVSTMFTERKRPCRVYHVA